MFGYLIVYCLGIATPTILQLLVLPKLKRWLKNKASKWK